MLESSSALKKTVSYPIILSHLANLPTLLSTMNFIPIAIFLQVNLHSLIGQGN